MSKDKQLRHRRKKTSIRKIGSAIVVAVLVMAIAFGMVPTNTEQVLAANYTADLNTMTKYTESLGDNVSTEYAGRIWTDKTVYSGNSIIIDAFGGAQYEVENDSDFLVGFSALATSQAVSGQTQAPIDVVFIIDISGSMSNQSSNMDNNYSRIYNTIQAVNTSIANLMELNPYTRVGVVGFSTNAITLLPLDRYTQNGNDAFFSLSRTTGHRNNATLYTRAVNSQNQLVSVDTSVSGGTNIQQGIYQGMNLLADATSTTAVIDGKEVTRVPSVILLSDGAPTYSSSSTSWWTPNNNTQGPGSGSYYGNGMLAMMMGAYMKDEVDRHYNVADTQFETTIYTIGMGITNLGSDDRALASVTLNPGQYFDSTTNSHAVSIKNAWELYCGTSGRDTTPDILVDEEDGGWWGSSDVTYTLTHPSTNDISGDALKNYVDRYYDADDASSVTNVFADIVSNISISTPEIPTEYDSANPLDSGFITYTDPIGEYMEVKDMKAIIYAGQKFEQHTKTTSGNVTTYTFTEIAEGNPIYGDHELSHIEIEVETTTDANGIKKQVLTIKVPAALIPIRVNTVQLNTDGTVKSHTNNGAYPIRVLYTVGLQEAVKSGDTVSLEMIDDAYKAKYMNADGTIDFYSNLYTGNVVSGNTVGDATAEFTAASTNPFYYMQKNVYLYEDEACTVPADGEELVADKTYYYKETYYHGTSIEEDIVVRTGAQLSGNTRIERDTTTGQWYRPAGTVRVNRMLEFEGTKSLNSTNTAQTFYEPTYDNDTGSFTVYLGNNGVMNVKATGTLEISKSVTATDGLTAPDQDFTFTVDLTDANDNALTGTYDYTVTDAEGNEVSTGTVANGGTITLKDGQTATIINLPPDAKYTVTESAVAGFTSSVNEVDTDTATGTITAGATSNADFVNNYSVTETTITNFPVGAKILEGRDWIDTDEYTFVLTPDNPNTTPMTEKTSVTVTQADLVDEKAVFDFGGVTLTKPGTYVYSMVEQVRELSGVTYSAAQYSVVIVVTDNGDGTLSAETKLYMMVDHHGTRLVDDENPYGVPVEDQVALFVNTYDATSTSYGQVVHKIYYDNTEGSRPLTDGMFQFKLEAGDDNTPMPHDTFGGVLYASNVGDTAIFEQITYTQEMAGNTYTYYITEVIPEGATENGDGTWTYNGMTYDGTRHTTTVRVYLDHSDVNEAKVALEVKYDDVSAESDAWYVEFTNAYTPAPTTVNLDGNKTLVGRDMKTDETFEFVLAPGNAATNLAVRTGSIVMGETTATVTGGTDGVAVSFEFEDATFRKPGTYLFNITETVGEAGGVTYDEHVCTVTVVVTDNNGQLEAAVTYNNGAGAADNTQAVFNNTYTATFDVNTAISLAGTKELTGRPLVDGEFFFEVVLENDGERVALVPAAGDADGAADANGVYEGTIQFLKDVTYTEAGTYTYLIREVTPNPKRGGMTYDASIYRATVVVTDDLNGTLTAELTKLEKSTDNGATYIEVSSVGIVFENAYETTPATVTPYEMTKVLTGKRNEGLEAGEFAFEKTIVSADPADGVILPNPSVITNDADGKIQFNDITFTKPGTYVIQIKEVVPEDAVENADGTYTKDGITYDTHVVQSTFQVTDDYEGNLIAVRTATTGSRTFNNVYESTGTLIGETNLKVTKSFTGREGNAWLSTDFFTFTLEAKDDVTRAAIADGKIVLPENAAEIIIDANDTVKQKAFGDIVFYEAGEYSFGIRENPGTIPGVDYDATERTITVKAVDNGDGTLTVTASGSENLTFNNVYNTDDVLIYGHGNLNVTKVLTGRENDEWLATDSFSFELAIDETDAATKSAYESGDIVMASNSLTITKDNKDHAHFGNITFKATGTYKFIVKEIPGTIPGVTYDEAEKTVIVTVTDNEDGTMSAVIAAESDPLTFTNAYSPEEVILDGETNLKITKELSGRDWNADDTFDFILEVGDSITEEAVAANIIEMEAPTEITVTENNKDNAYFGDITFKEAGQYRFRIREMNPGDSTNLAYDRHSTVVIVTVTDDAENGKLTVSDVETVGSMTWVNVYTPNAVNVTLTGVKEIVGRELTAGDRFNFSIAVAEDSETDTPLPTMITVQNNKADIVFGPITYTAAGTYKYIITEGTDHVPGIVNDSGYVVATVEVTYDSEEGVYNYTTSYEKVTAEGIATEDGFKFINTYSSSGTLEGRTHLKVTKNFTGRVNDEWLPEDSFTFTLAADETHEDTVKAVQDGYITLPDNKDGITISGTDTLKENAFGNIVFTKTGTYQFVVKETKGNIAGVTYDESLRVIKVEVTDNWDGTMAVTVSEDSASLTFNNTYDTTETTLAGATNLKVTKNFTGRVDNEWLATDEFIFTLAVDETHTSTVEALAAGNIVMPEVTLKVTNANKNDAHFGDITFKEPGLYKFVVTETTGDIPGVTYSTATKNVTVSVVDNQNGTMTASVVEANSDELVFENTYHTESVTATLAGMKTMDGRDWKSTDIFEFTIAAVTDGAPMPEETTVSNAADGTITFAPITYTSVGTYVYEIRETGGSVAGVTNATNVVTATVTVTDDTVGYLVADVAYSDGGFAFTNTYQTEETDSVKLSATKTVIPSEGNSYTMQGGEFEFTITPSANNPTSDPVQAGTVSNNAEGAVVFAQDVKYTEAGTYTYTVQEVSGNLGGMSYDGDIYEITVEVTDDESTAKLSAVVTIKKNDETVDAITFDNGYDPTETAATISGTKELTVNGNKDKKLEADEFAFKLTAVDNAPMPESDTVKNTEAGVFQFGSITYTAPGTYKYAVSEINEGKKGYSYDSTVYEVTVTVVDENGALKVEENTSITNSIVFENTYTPDSVTLQGDTALKGMKVLEGRKLAAGEFTFQLVNEAGTVVLESTNDADGNFKFEPLTFTETGIYYYTIKEAAGTVGGVTYDDNSYVVKITVTDAGGYLVADTAYLNADAGVKFVNTYEAAEVSVTLDATKKLSGRGLRADEFTFQLIDADGTVVSEATNDENGTVLFDTLTFGKAGEYVYTVAEIKGEAGYILYDENVYTVTVTVTDDMKGSLHADVVMENNSGAKATEMVFNNTYTPADVAVTLSGTKTLNGRDLEADEFTFEVYNATDTFEISGDAIMTVKNAADGTINFNELVFTQAGTYYYVVVENSSNADAEIIYDDAVYAVTIKVTDDGEGALVAETTLMKAGESVKTIEFVNTYEKTEEPGVPQTGDYNNIWMWMALLSGSIGVISTAVYSKKRK